MKNIALVPARIGSQRFPKKNIAALCGIPLIAYAIKAAKCATKIDRVFVSTDSIEIADIAKAAGATVPFLRPSDLADDKSTIDDVCRHFLNRIDTNNSISTVCLIQPTSPFVMPKDISLSVDMLEKDPLLDSVTTVSKTDHRHHPYNLGAPINSEIWQHLFLKERRNNRTRQSKPDIFKLCNLVTVRSEIIRNDNRFGKKMGYIICEDLLSWDIDYRWQLDMAELLIKEKYVKVDHMNLKI